LTPSICLLSLLPSDLGGQGVSPHASHFFNGGSHCDPYQLTRGSHPFISHFLSKKETNPPSPLAGSRTSFLFISASFVPRFFFTPPAFHQPSGFFLKGLPGSYFFFFLDLLGGLGNPVPPPSSAMQVDIVPRPSPGPTLPLTLSSHALLPLHSFFFPPRLKFNSQRFLLLGARITNE